MDDLTLQAFVDACADPNAGRCAIIKGFTPLWTDIGERIRKVVDQRDALADNRNKWQRACMAAEKILRLEGRGEPQIFDPVPDLLAVAEAVMLRGHAEGCSWVPTGLCDCLYSLAARAICKARVGA